MLESPDLPEAVRTRIDAIRPVVDAHGSSAEVLGRLPDEVVAALAANDLYSMAVPKTLGGLELDPTTFLRAVVELSRLDSAVGWNANQCCGGAIMAARLGAKGVAELFGDAGQPVLAGAAFPPCSGTRAEGGFEVSGTVRYVSGVHAADWVFAMFMMSDGGDAPTEVRVGFFATADVEVLDTWHVMGMRGTGSCDIALSQAFVPEHRTALMTAPSEPVEAFSGALYRISPWNVVLGEAAVSLGIARRALDLGIELAGSKYSANTRVRAADRELVQTAVGRARARIESAWSYLRDAIAGAAEWAERGEPIPQDHRLSLQLAACTAAEAGADAVDLVYEALGSSSFHADRGIEQCFRDVHVLTQHGTKSVPRYTSVGRVILGLDPDVPTLG